MSIKQIGGVFGRNPTFNDVTIEGQLTFDGDIDINSDLKVDGELEVTGEILANGGITVGDKKVNLGSTGGAQLTLASGAITVTASNHQLLNEGGAASDDLDTINSGTSGDILILSAASNGQDINVKNSTGNIVLSVASGDCTLGNIKDKIILIYQGSAWYEISRSVNASGATADFTVSGNLVMGTSGKGIDFSATAGTGTSELFDDYEEGVFIATLTPATSGTITITTTGDELAYTKVGRQVFINGMIIVDSVSSPVGASVKLNLPFTTANLGDSAGRSTGVSTQNTSGAYLLTPIYSFEAAVEAEIIFDASTVTAAHRFYFSLSYITA